MWRPSAHRKNIVFSPCLIKHEEAKLWTWGSWLERCCFPGRRPKASVSVCPDDIIFLLSHISDTPAVLSASPHIFYRPQHWVSDWLEISLKLHDPICKAWWSRYPAVGRALAWLSPFLQLCTLVFWQQLWTAAMSEFCFFCVLIDGRMHWFPLVVVSGASGALKSGRKDSV